MVWAPIQQVPATGTASLVFTVAGTKPGSRLVIDFGADSFNVSGISGGGTWALDKSTGNGHLFSGTWAAVCDAVVTTVTLTFLGTNVSAAGVFSELPLIAYAPVDATNAGSGASVTPATGNVTPLAAENVAWGMVAHRGTYSSGPTGGFTGGIEAKVGSVAVRTAWLEQHTKTAAGTTWTLSGSANWDTAIISYEMVPAPDTYQTVEPTDQIAVA